MANKRTYTVQGTVKNKEDQPLKGLLVRATDEDPNTPENLLGTPVYTDVKGHYKITYTNADFRLGGKERGGADIIIRVFSPEGELLGKTKRHNNSPQHATIDIEVDYTPTPAQDKKNTVSGTISLADGQMANGYFVQVFNKQLRTKKLLGEAMVDKNGKYSVTWSTKIISRTKQKGKDIFIKIFDVTNLLVGQSDILFNAPRHAKINYQIEADQVAPLSTFQLIQKAVKPVLGKLLITKLEESKKHRDISYLSGEAGYSKNQILHFVQGHVFEKESKADAPFWFVVLGISFFQDLPFSDLKDQRERIKSELKKLDDKGIRKALKVAFTTNKIKKVSDRIVKKWLNLFKAYVANVEITIKNNFTKVALEEVGIKDQKKQAKFATLLNKYRSFSPELVKELKKDKDFKVAEIKDLQTSYQLSNNTNGDINLIKSIKKTFKVRDPKNIPLLAKRSKKEWKTLVEKTNKSKPLSIPYDVEIPKEFKGSYLDTYGESLHRQFTKTYPTMAFVGGLERALEGGTANGLKFPGKVEKVINKNRDFKLLTSSIDKLAETDNTLKRDEELKFEFKAIQRVFKLAPNFEATNTLLKDKQHSAHGIYRMGESAFVGKYSNQPGFNKEKARVAWRKAEATHAATVSLIAELKTRENAGKIAALKTDSKALSDFPNWNNLFKGGDICECKHCRSVYSPAAYFADIMMFLKDRNAKGMSGESVKKILLERRPDLAYLELNCDNANVTLPYIDVVNEVLEAVVADGGDDVHLTGFTTIDETDMEQATTDVVAALNDKNIVLGENVHLAKAGADNWIVHSDTITYLLKRKTTANYYAEVLRNTKAKADELRANPQYVNSTAYEILKQAPYPFALPFDMFGEEVSASFNKIKLKRQELMQKFRGTAAPNNASEVDVAAVYFGISVDTNVTKDEKTILTEAAPTSQFKYWGYPSNTSLLNNIKNVSTFLRVTGLTYNELLTLLDLEFINPDGSIHINHLNATCDTDQKEIIPLSTEVLDRINRFLRLWRKLDWKMWEVDLVIMNHNIGKEHITEELLVNLMYLVELKTKLGKKVDIEKACSLFGNINTTTRFTELHEQRDNALYQDLFLNKKLINPIDEAFEVAAVDVATNTETINSHRAVVEAALRLKEADLDYFLELPRASDGTLYIDKGGDGDLTLTNLSFLYRHSLIAKSLKLDAEEWTLFLKLYDADVEVFDTPKSACDFVKGLKTLVSSEFDVDELNYLMTADMEADAAMTEAEASGFLLTLRNSINQINEEYDAASYDYLQEVPPTETESLEELFTSLLQKLNKDDEGINYNLNILENIATTELVVGGLDTVGFTEFPAAITNNIKIQYNATTEVIRFTGLMTDAQRTTLLTDASLSAITGIAAYQDGIEELYQKPRLSLKFYDPKFSTRLAILPEGIDFEEQVSSDLSEKISYNTKDLRLEFSGFMTVEDKTNLENLSSDTSYLDAINLLYAQPTTGVFDTTEIWLSDTDLGFTSTSFYEENLVLAIEKLLVYFTEKETKSAIITQLSEQLELSSNITEKLVYHYQLIGTDTIFDYFKNTLESSTAVLDYAGFKDLFDTVYWMHRASLFINKWVLDFDKLEWLITYNTPSETIDFNNLPIDGTEAPALLDRFLRAEKLFSLNLQYKEDDISILSMMGKLQDGEYVAISDFAEEVETLTEWDAEDVENWVTNVDLDYTKDYLLAENWIRLQDCMKMLKQLGTDTKTAINYANATMTDTDSQKLKELLRTKYGVDTWLTISTEIQDELRERKRDALAAYLLAQPEPADAPSGKWENTNDLYAYYLLDIEMSSCMLTSRLVQGSGSVQLFVQRCFMGLEPDIMVISDGDEGDSAWRWWKWMRKYRVWEANRKVFLYPENWIEPELRSDKSSFFQDLENELLQNEINELSVEQAYLNYLDKLNNVARLEVAAYYHEDDADLTIMHVFGRSANADPHVYYYRQYDYSRWTPWEKIEVDIVGNHLIPMVVNKRLYIYWPEFKEIPDEEMNNSVNIPNAGDTGSTLPPNYKRTELRLAGSEFRNNKWTPKKISKEYFKSYYDTNTLDTSAITFFPIDKTDLEGRLGIKVSGSWYDPNGDYASNASFELFGCDGIPVKSNLSGYFQHVVTPDESALNSLNYVEVANRTDYPGNDFSLATGLDNQFIEVLLKTPNRFKTYFAWHLSYMDKLLMGLEHFYGQFKFGDNIKLPMGSWLPFFYADKYRTFMALPMLNVVEMVPEGDADLGIKTTNYYYPEMKESVRSSLKEAEETIRVFMEAIDLSTYSDALKLYFANIIAPYMGLEPFTSITDEELVELSIKFYLMIWKFYYGGLLLAFFNVRKYHFKNFYHPFVCDFIKTVYNPTMGIPAMMSRETQMKETSFSFDRTYGPQQWVYDHNIGKEYPKEIVDFSPDGSYSPYNWELFYHAPLMIANSLSNNQKFEEAMEWYHYIFNPIGVEGKLPDGTNAAAPQKYWITKPFFLTTNDEYNEQRIDSILNMLAGEQVDDPGNTIISDLENQIKNWRYYPFEPHRIAQNRNVAYQKTVFMKYLDNLVAWGDYLFRQDSMESINEATQLYILGAELLGPRPKTIPPQVKPPIETFSELEEDFDAFSNALIQVENYIPMMSEGGSDVGTSAPIPTLYFCIPQNDKILSYWDTVADRLYKIRNCMNIEGVVRALSLFEPPIDPGALVKAVAGGLDISSALADLNAPLPYYRFNNLLQKANDVCNDLKAMSAALLSALEKKDAEAMALLRQGHEYKLLSEIKSLRETQIEEAKVNLDALKETKKLIEIKRDYYRDIEKINSKEQLHIDKLTKSNNYKEAAEGVTLAASIISLLPDIDLGASGFGGTPLATFKIGGINLGQASKLASDILNFLSLRAKNDAAMASINGSHERRWDDWKHQEDLADQEINQTEEQINAAEIRIKIAEKELSNQELQMKNSKEVDDFMKSKYTNKDLYQWMVGQISQVYFKSYQLAYDLAKKAERCYRFELGLPSSDFIKFGYWDSLKKGLLSGEKLQYDLRRLEASYMEKDKRELELTKHISLAMLDPIALIKMRETGKCFFSLPEEIFDLDYPGHYFRRIKSVSISLPCVAGPHTTIACTLRMLNNHIRVETGLADGYSHNNEEGIWVNDSRFVQNNISIKAIATSNGQNDSGVFELSFNDVRYLPFENAGVISDWTIDLFNDTNAADLGRSLRQFDYSTISDAIIHIRYTAREAGGLLKDGALTNLSEYYGTDDGSPGMKILNLKHDFSSAWHKMEFPDVPANGNVLSFKIKPTHFPYRDQEHTIKINSITLVARCSNENDYDVFFSPPLDDTPADNDKLVLTQVAEYGNLHYATRDTSGDGLELDFSSDVVWEMSVESPSGDALTEGEIGDFYLVLGYEWE